MRMGRGKTAVFILLLLAAAGFLLMAGKPKSLRWRLELLAAKASGRMPDEAWGQVFRWVRGTWRNAPYSPLSGVARLKQTGLGGSCPALWDTPYGPMRARIEDDLFLEHHLSKSWNFQPGMPQVRPGDVVVEVGAWVGCLTKFALAAGAARVIAIEPVPANLECLRMNLAEEIRAGKVLVVGAAAWNQAVELKMDLTKYEPDDPDSNEGWGVMESGPLTVEGITIDEVLEQAGVTRVDLINLDVEGGERYALAGARRTLERFRPAVVVCLHHLPDDEQAIPPIILTSHPSYRMVFNRGGHGVFASPETRADVVALSRQAVGASH